MIPRFLQQMMNSSRVREDIEGRSGGSTQKVINTKEVARTRVVVPPLAEQGTIVDSLVAVDEQVDTHLSTLDGLQQVKAGLLQDLLTGKVRVSV